MKGKFSNALSLALIVSMLFTSIAFADQVVNNIDNTVDSALETRSITSDESTVVGFYIKSITGGGDANGCNATGSEEAYFTVTPPAGVTVSWDGYPNPIEFVGCDNYRYVTFSSSTPGSYTISDFTMTGGKTNSQWDFSTAAFTLKVTGKSSATVTLSNLTQTYTGSPLSPTATTIPAGLAIVWTNAPQTNAGSYAVTATVDDPNYEGSASSTFVINKANATVTLSDLTHTYTGSPLSPTATTSPAGLSIDWTGAPQTNAGSYPVTATVNDANYQGTASGTFVINKADAGCSISGYTGVYDSAPHGASGSCTGVGTLDLGASFTGVPGGTADWSFTGNANYNDDSGSVDIVISQAPVTATAGSGSGTYNGLEQSPSACVVTGGYTGDLSCANVPPSVGPDAGTYPITPAVSGTGLTNFSITPVNGSYEIEKADATCVVNGFTGTYDGNAHGATGTCTGVNGEDLSAGLNLGTSFTDYPGGTVNWTFSGGTNYNDQSGSVAIVINKAPVTATASSGSSIYDGFAKSPSACAVTGLYTGDLTCANDPLSVGPNADAYTIAPVVSGTGLSNFDITPVNGTYTINKADATCAVTGYSVYYDGIAHTATGQCTGVLGETLTGLDLSGTTHTLVGNYTDNWTFTDVTGNYNNTSGTVNDVILAWTLSGFYQPVDMDKVNTVKGGSTVPLKFNIFAGETELTDPSYVQYLMYGAVACNASAPNDDIETLASGATSLRYDWTSGQFVYNWKTPKTTGCFSVTVKTYDGSTLVAYFKLK
jgi:hypothetical protein